MELEWNQLELRYERLRRRHPAQERQLLSSMAELGQQIPIIVVSHRTAFVVIDGYKRVRALKRLGRDTVRSMQWSVSEMEVLLLERSLRQGSEDTLDQAWLLVELQQRFGLSVEVLAQRFERSKSWVSRRLSLVQALPQVIQDQVRVGILSAQMVAFAERYGFVWQAHEKGDANRSARVEAPFHRIEQGFLTGEDFADWADLNQRARQTCEIWNAKFSNKLHASRRELFAAEQPHLLPLPLHVPEVYQLSTRIVDAEGFVNVNRIRYSVPYQLIGRSLEVHETLDRVDLYAGARRVATHMRTYGEADTRITDPAHRPPRGQRFTRRPQLAPEEAQILQIEPTLSAYLQGQYASNRRTPLRRLLRMLQEYPRAAFLKALACAEQYRLFDLDRLERMVLRQIADDYFVFPLDSPAPEPSDE